MVNVSAKELLHIEGRNKVLANARSLMIAAFYQGLLAKHPSEAVKEKAFASAVEIVSRYIDLYEAPERVYHTSQHALVQILPLSKGMRANLLNKMPTSVTSWKDTEKILKQVNLVKELPRGPKWHNARLPVKVLSMNDFWRYLRDQMRHDCLYYLPNYRDENGNRSIQTELIARIREAKPALTLEDVITREDIGKSFEVILNGQKISLNPHLKIKQNNINMTVGELAAICTYPDGKGGYDKTRDLSKHSGGLNEWASAVYAIQMENDIRQQSNFPPLSAKEVMQTCVLLAVTVPFQNHNYLDKVARNVERFLRKPQNKSWLKPLGVVVFTKRITGNLRFLVGLMVLRGTKFAGQDIRNFRAGNEGLYDGDKAVLSEIFSVKDEQKNIFSKCFIAWKCFTDLSALQDIKPFDNTVKSGGFLRSQGEKNRIWHYFQPTTSWAGGEIALFVVRRAKVNKLHKKFLRNADAIRKWHQCDLVTSVIEIARQCGDPIALEGTLTKENLQKHPKEIPTQKIEALTSVLLESGFWSKYKSLLLNGGVKDIENFKAAKKALDVIYADSEQQGAGQGANHKQFAFKATLDKKNITIDTVKAVRDSLDSDKQKKYQSVIEQVLAQKEQTLSKNASRG